MSLGLNVEFSSEAPVEQLLDDRYQIVDTLSQGNWGRTYIAIDTHPAHRPGCIVRELRPAHCDPTSLDVAQRLFQHEIKVLEALGQHEQIARLIDWFQVGPTFYVVQDFIDGHPLSAELHGHQPWSEDRVVTLLQSILPVLDFVHSQGFVHGDLQPDNLIRRYQDGQLILTDFSGIKQIRTPLIHIQEQIRTTMALGALGYMSTEQVRGIPRASSDIYALGMIAIQALTGLSPLQLEEDPHTGEVVWQHQVPVSAPLAAVLTRMVRYHFKSRYQCAAEVLHALANLTGDVADSPAEQAAHPTGAAAQTVNPAVFDRSSPHESVPGHLSVPPSSALTSGQSAPPSDSDEASDKIDLRPQTIQLVSPTQAPVELTHLSRPGYWKIAGAATSVALVSAAGGYFLFATPDSPGWESLGWKSWGWFDRGTATLGQATGQYQAGNFQAAVDLAASIPTNSAAYAEAQAKIAQWQQTWQQARSQFQTIEATFMAEQWAGVLTQAQQMPQTEFWQGRLAPMVRRSQDQLDRLATQSLAEAEELAQVKDFKGAIAALAQISELASEYDPAQEKQEEYEAQYVLQAEQQLEQAYSDAKAKNFTAALSTLAKIPEDTPVYDTAQAKIQEYSQKEKIRGTYYLQRAYNRAIVKDFDKALSHLQSVPVNTPAYAIAQAKIQEYRQKQRRQSAASGSKSVSETVPNVNIEPALDSISDFPNSDFSAAPLNSDFPSIPFIEESSSESTPVELDNMTQPLSSSLDARSQLEEGNQLEQSDLNPGHFFQEAAVAFD